MVMINHQLTAPETPAHPTQLTTKTQRDLTELLNQYATPTANNAPQPQNDPQPTTLAYSIPMPGVRYYMINQER